jgi:5-methylcytosine-specific restriction enzyme B
MVPVSFPWIPIYRELGQRLLDYRDRQDELITVLREATEQGLKVIPLSDRMPEGHVGTISEIDPFSFFASFNRTNNYRDRALILALQGSF